MDSNNIYDITIIGGGPAGLTSSIYAARYKLKTIVFTNNFGGMMSSAHKVCNYPGFINISGMDLTNKMMEQSKSLDVEISFEGIVNIIKKEEENIFIVESESKSIKSKKVIIAIGQKRRQLNLPREEEFIGKGISYCATCDGNFYKNKTTAVVGGSDAAVTAALLLADISNKVYLIYRKDKLRAVPSWIELVNNNSKVEILYNTEIIELIGSNKLEKIKLNTNKEIELDGLFVEIGSVPNKDFTNKLNIDCDEKALIKVDKSFKTNIPGIFAAGDCTNATELKQIITACSQGAIASYNAYKEITENI
jgi:thioredoxin reductase (NADPH)